MVCVFGGGGGECVVEATHLSSTLNVVNVRREKEEGQSQYDYIWMSPPPACLNRQDLHVVYLARAAGQGEEVSGWVGGSSHPRGAQGVAVFGKTAKKEEKKKKKKTGSLSKDSLWP